MKPELTAEAAADDKKESPAADSPLPDAPAPAAPKLPAKTAHHKLWRWLGPLLFLATLLAAGAAVWWQQDAIRDWTILRNYQPPAAIQSLADDTTMTDRARRLFYVNEPSVEQRDAFNTHCTSVPEEGAVLGCFLGDRLGIFIYAVTDARLDGIQEVTAAHEMLHQAYARLDDSERRRIDGLLTAYAKTVTDQGLLDKIELYRQTEPQDVANEMHSVFGTEVTELPAELEEYYRRYFADRQRVIAFYQQYRTAFDQIEKQIEAYKQQLAELKPQIESSQADLEQREQALTQEREQLDAYLASGQIATYNAAVGPYNSRVGAYKKALNTSNELVRRYNEVVDAVNALGLEQQHLLQAQDSRAEPTAGQQ